MDCSKSSGDCRTVNVGDRFIYLRADGTPHPEDDGVIASTGYEIGIDLTFRNYEDDDGSVYDQHEYNVVPVWKLEWSARYEAWHEPGELLFHAMERLAGALLDTEVEARGR